MIPGNCYVLFFQQEFPGISEILAGILHSGEFIEFFFKFLLLINIFSF